MSGLNTYNFLIRLSVRKYVTIKPEKRINKEIAGLCSFPLKYIQYSYMKSVKTNIINILGANLLATVHRFFELIDRLVRYPLYGEISFGGLMHNAITPIRHIEIITIGISSSRNIVVFTYPKFNWLIDFNDSEKILNKPNKQIKIFEEP